MRKHTPSARQRLILHRETVRTLCSDQLAAAHGGNLTIGPLPLPPLPQPPQPFPTLTKPHPQPPPNTTTIASAVGAC